MVSAICAKLCFADCVVDGHVSEKTSVLLAWTSVFTFDALETSLFATMILHKLFVIHCDANQCDLKAALMQRIVKEDVVSIAQHTSKYLTEDQRNYTITEQECLAAVETVSKCRAYIEEITFENHHDRAQMANESVRPPLFDITHSKSSQYLVAGSL